MKRSPVCPLHLLVPRLVLKRTTVPPPCILLPLPDTPHPHPHRTVPPSRQAPQPLRQHPWHALIFRPLPTLSAPCTFRHTRRQSLTTPPPSHTRLTRYEWPPCSSCAHLSTAQRPQARAAHRGEYCQWCWVTFPVWWRHMARQREGSSRICEERSGGVGRGCQG